MGKFGGVVYYSEKGWETTVQPSAPPNVALAVQEC